MKSTGEHTQNARHRWRQLLALLLDMGLLLLVSIVIFYLTPDTNGTASNQWRNLWPGFFQMAVCILLFQVLLRTYDTLWRYAESREYLTLLLGMTGGTLLNLLAMRVFGQYLSRIFVCTTAGFALLAMLAVRMLYRRYREIMTRRTAKGGVYTGIIGAGEAGVSLMLEMRANPAGRFQPYCFFDDNPEKIGTRVHGLRVYGPIEALPQQISNLPVSELVVAIPALSAPRRREILDICTRTSCHVSVLPDRLEMLENGKAVSSMRTSMREVRIEDLLGRAPVQLDTARMRAFLQDKTVLVTGGGGSIGSELCRQIARCRPKRLVILDIYENGAYDVQQELVRRYGDALDLRVEIASVRDRRRLYQVFSAHRPEVVFHAAAHKHVPLMEESPTEAVKNNVFGTWNTVSACETFGVGKFVLISTDKAVNPTNVMGATKRMCEQILQSRRGVSHTEFAAVRFGNVLGSNGSVIPLFQRQIAAGGPVTVTDKRIIRYFMTIPEAAQLVLEAGAMAHGGEVYVLDMGEPVKILDLAEKLVRLSGYVPYRDIDIVEIGLRPGEKLYEELLMQSEHLSRTENNKIFIEQQEAISPHEIGRMLEQLKRAADSGSAAEMRRALHACVQTYHSAEQVNREAIEQMELRTQCAAVGEKPS